MQYVGYARVFIRERFGPLAPQTFAVLTFLAGAILLFSGATPARAGRLGWVNDLLPLPVVEASAYFASVAGVGLIVLARGLQHRLVAAFRLTLLLLIGGIVFSIASALDIGQAIVLSVMSIVLVASRRQFHRKSSILEERYTTGWLAAIVAVFAGAIMIAVSSYDEKDLGLNVFWRFAENAQGPRAERALLIAAVTLAGFGIARLFRPAQPAAPTASTADLADAEVAVSLSRRASAQLAFLGDKALMFHPSRRTFLMYGVAGRSWVTLGDPVGDKSLAPELIATFIEECSRHGGWPVFYRVSPRFLALYLDYALGVVKLGEVARVNLLDFSLDGPTRRNLRRVWRKAVDDGCSFRVIDASEHASMIPQLAPISSAWMTSRGVREKGFSLGRFDPTFVDRSTIGVVFQHDRPIAFTTLWTSGAHAEVEADLMRYLPDAPPGIMRYALIEAMLWARAQGFEKFNLGAAPLSGIKTSAVTPVWNQLSVAVRGVGERYYNFKGLREFKNWFYPEWESTYLVSPGGAKRPIIISNISALISGGLGGTFRK